jgi:Rrf2 family nitric oxide-sensitive transcriptional repressor
MASLILSAMKLVPTRRTDQAVRAMLYLGALPDGRARAAEIAAACEAPTSSIQQVLQVLTRARLLDSSSSASGGYELRTGPEQISLLQVIEAVEGTLDIQWCALASQPCNLVEECTLHQVVAAAIVAFRARLSAAMLADLITDGVPKPGAQRSDGS